MAMNVGKLVVKGNEVVVKEEKVEVAVKPKAISTSKITAGNIVVKNKKETVVETKQDVKEAKPSWKKTSSYVEAMQG